MNISQFSFAKEMFQKIYWWCLPVDGQTEKLIISKNLQQLVGSQVSSLQELAGVFESQLIRLKVNELIKNPESEIDIRFVANFETVNGHKSFQHQLRIFDQDGEKFVWANCLDVTEMVDLEKEIVSAHGRTSLAQMQQKQDLLEQQNELIRSSYEKQSRFLALLSHELRSPLLGISSLVKRLRDEYDGADQVLNMLTTINMTAEQANYLVSDILTYSQTEYDGITLHPSQVSLPELLDNVKRLTKSIAADKNLFVSLVYLSEHDQVYVDGVRLTQVLINLIVNAIKFTQIGGVNIEVNEISDGEFSFKVTDSGEGIREEQLTHIFEPFAQLDSNDETIQRSLGAGLGLFVVRQLVQLMGSDIKVQSINGVGTTFEFSLKLDSAGNEKRDVTPLTKVQTPTDLADQSVVKAEPKSLDQRYKVLVADDSKINRMVLTGYLSDLKCQFVEAGDGRQAWELFQQDGFDYVLLDIQMPHMDGVEVSKKIKSVLGQNKYTDLKGVFAITAGGESTGFTEIEGNPQLYGFDEWLVKPVSKEQIRRLFAKHYRADSIEPESELDTIESVNSQNNNLMVTKADIPKTFHHLVEAFCTEMSEGLEQMAQFNQKQQLPDIKRKAHYLKGNCMLFQLKALAEQLKALELLQDSGINEAARSQQALEILEKISKAVKFLEKSG